ncbi:hypothetical protein LshimejAT787_0902130 [Lyophyllum shimeji]|uniref:Uncharacterized protein n=1 Tax=Lyophyllum shimeji TaxID=47721 RepID=A0A9P3PSX9_LYOSH|nr:hypothetical protein LshimejAT787_0902130 [Lyophyllum shimeji]
MLARLYRNLGRSQEDQAMVQKIAKWIDRPLQQYELTLTHHGGLEAARCVLPSPATLFERVSEGGMATPQTIMRSLQG